MAHPGDPVFVVNPRSGGRDGWRLLQALRARLGPGRVHSIADAALVELARAVHGSGGVLVACGGDGTAAALLEAAWVAAAGGEPVPVAVWPLGTGNDLARHSRAPLGGGMDERLAWLAAAVPRVLDRWMLHGPAGDRPWFNYCSWGCDARIAERFHRLRDQHPWAFSSRLTNLACYAALGLQEQGAALALQLRGAGASSVPTWLRSLVLANIPSYAGGRRLGDGISADDGACDAFALPSGLALGLGLSGVRRPRNLGAHRDLDLHLARPAFLQVDGEPLAAPAGRYRVRHGGRVRLLVAG